MPSMDAFITFDYLQTFAGAVAAVTLIVQFTKGWVRSVFGDMAVRPYAWVWAFLLLTFVQYAAGGLSGDFRGCLTTLVLTGINAIPVALGAIATYHVIRHCDGDWVNKCTLQDGARRDDRDAD